MIKKLLLFVRSLFLNFSNSSKKRSFNPSLRMLCLGMFLLSILGHGQSTWTGTVSNDWNTAGNWSPSGVPANGSAVIIPSITSPAVYPILNINKTCASITFTGTNQFLTVNSGITLTVTGAVLVQSSNSSSRNITITGAGSLTCASLTIGNTSTPNNSNPTTNVFSSISNLNISGTGNLTIVSSTSGSNTNNGGFYLESGILDLNGQITTTNGASNTSTFSMASGAQSGTLLLGNTSPFALSGTGSNTITLNGTSSTVNYDRTNNQTVRATTYNNLILSGSGTKTFAGTTTIMNNLTIDSGVVASLGGSSVIHNAGALTLGGYSQNSGSWGGTASAANYISETYFGTSGNGRVNAGATCTEVTVTISGSNLICKGANASFTATTTYAITPSYQWKVNGADAGTNSSSFSSATLSNNDLVTCVVTSGVAPCLPSGSTATSNSITMAVSTITATATPSTVASGGNTNLTTSISPTSYTATLLTQDFNSTPTGWTTTNNSSGGTPANAAWTLRPDGYFYEYTGSGSFPPYTFRSNDKSQFYLSNSAAQNGSSTATTLVTPVMNSTGYTNLSLEFYQFYDDYDGDDSVIVEVNTTSGSPGATGWTNVATYTSDQGLQNGFFKTTVNLNSYINNTTLYVRFRYAAQFEWFWAIDNVKITGSKPVAYTYSWAATPSGSTAGLAASAATASLGNASITANPTQTTSYVVTATNSVTSCNVASTATVVTVTPTISSFSPTSACSGSGIPVVITGSGFTGATAVNFNGVSASFTVDSNTQITATLPATATTGTISITTASGTTTSSSSFTLNTAPSVTTQPSASSVCPGSNTSFSVVASGTLLTYQWQFSTNGGTSFANLTNTGVYSTVTSSTMNITGATSGMNNYQYRCVISGSCTPAATSNAVALTLNTAPSVTTQPSASSVCPGSNTSFSVVASGTLLTYQWQFSTNGGTSFANLTNTGVYSTVTSSTMNITGATSGMNNYQYRCVISGSCTPAATSNAVALTLNTAPSVTTQPSASSVCPGSNTSFSVVASGTLLTYQWQFSTNGGTSFANLTNTGVYSTVTSSTMNITGATSGMNNYQYRCVISGSCTPAATSNAVALTLNTAPSVTTQPSASSVCPGSNTSFSVVASGTLLTYQWQFSTNGGTSFSDLTNTGVYSTVTSSTMNITGATSGMNNYQYRCVISGSCTPAATSNAVALTLNTAPSVTTQPSASSVCPGSNTSFSVVASGTLLTYQWQFSTNGGTSFANLTNTGVYSTVTSSTMNITGATSGMNNYQYRCVISGSCTPAATSNAVALTLNTAPSVTTQPSASSVCPGSNTSFSVVASGTLLTYQWQFSTNGGTSFSDLTNTGVYSTVTSSTMNITGATSGMNNYQYRCVISGSCTPAATSNAVALTLNTAPSVTTQPSASSVCPGSNTSFSVVASGTLLTYQWQFSTNGGTSFSDLTNTGVYSTVTSSTMNITGATSGMNNYQYRCVISGSCTPAATSNAVALTLNTAPSVTTQPSASSVCPGSNTSFSVVASGTLLTYQWQFSTNGGTSFSDLTNTGVYSTVTSSTMNITGATSGMNNYQYRCVISGSCTPAATSNAVALTLNTVPTTPTASVTIQPSCGVSTGTIVVNTPQSGIEYSIDGTNYSASGTFTGVPVGSYTVTAKNSTDCIATMAGAPLVVSSPVTKTWQGGQGTGSQLTDWSYGPNWNPVGKPTSADCVIVPTTANNPVVSGTNLIFYANTLSVIASGSLVVKSSNTLQVTDGITVAPTGTLTFEDSSSLIQTNTDPTINTGSINYIRTTLPIRLADYVYWSTPVQGQTLAAVSPLTESNKYFKFNGTGWVGVSPASTMVIGKGYIIRGPEGSSNTVRVAYTATFKGTPNNGTVTTEAFDANKYYLVGNPYPSALDADTFITDLNNRDVLEGTLYFWTHNTPVVLGGAYKYNSDDYASYNLTGGNKTMKAAITGVNDPGNIKTAPQGYIAAGQSFMAGIKAPGQVRFTNAMRTAGSDNGQFFKPGKTSKTTGLEKNRLWLNMTNEEGAFKQTLVGYIEGATNDYDNGYDGLSFDGNKYVDFYSMNNSGKYVIQGRALPFTNTDLVPLGYKSTIAGDFTIAIDHADGFLSTQPIYLEDKTTGKIHDLRAADYTFTTAIGSFTDRFVLRYTNKTLGTGDFENVDNGLLVSVKDKTIKVTSANEEIKEVTVFDINGKLLYNKKKIGSAELSISNLQAANQVLLVKVILENGSVTTKKIIFQ